MNLKIKMTNFEKSFFIFTMFIFTNVLTALTGQRRRRGWGRRRNALPELSEDLQGNDYEVFFCCQTFHFVY